MKLVSFRRSAGDGARFGALVAGGAAVLDFSAAAAGVPTPERYLDWFDLDGGALTQARHLHDRIESEPGLLDTLRDQGAIVPRDQARLLAPVPRPGKVICIGLNYRDHAEESGMEIPESPVVFSKFPTSITHPDGPVVLPPTSSEVDYEAELAVIIGSTMRRVSEKEALSRVLGYSCFNDVSARDFQFSDGQWQRGKSCDTFAPLGPFIATTDEIPDPHDLSIRLRLNGETLQDSRTDQLIFGIPRLIAFLSATITLEPGDVIATGTPPGVGFARKPPIYIKNGDTMEVEIDGLGVLSNPVTADQRGS